ncbi:hypothetical protein A6J48_13270 [Neisseria meningitidis]|nr:hypothetical protein A6J48_13270 [Neisseria meningitidis]
MRWADVFLSVVTIFVSFGLTFFVRFCQIGFFWFFWGWGGIGGMTKYKFPCGRVRIPACAGMTDLSARKPVSRHSHESGNLETQSCKNLSEMTETQRTWIPTFVGMTEERLLFSR